ncbi:MAG: GNAT family N-acetyltransferase [Deltaproteobacteria bacterium]|nr:GNAT family N-acetyltransferase [Deltaproteobacteria bacterium]
MPGYRFCRSDDLRLLVAAHNACWVPHFGVDAAITIEDFKRGGRELGLWASSCMIAFEGDEPIGVLIAAKRDGEANYVWRLAVKPGYERQGHGRHLLTSLADKAAILGPPRLAAEIPAEWTAVRSFFERSGFVAEETYADFVLDPAPAAVVDAATAPLLVPVAFDDLVEHGVFDPTARRAWGRSTASLRACESALEGLALATDRIEAYVIFRASRGGDEREIVALGAAPDVAAAPLLALLIERVRAGGRRLRLPMLAERETSFATLERLGFRRARTTIGYAVARPA